MSASVAAGIVPMRRPSVLPWRMSAQRSGRFTGSPPLRTKTGVPIAATSASSRSPSAVVSSSGCALRLRRGAAVRAREVAGLGRLPDDEERRLGEVDVRRGVHTVFSTWRACLVGH